MTQRKNDGIDQILSPKDLAELLTKESGLEITVEQVTMLARRGRLIKKGKINLLAYTAFLIQEHRKHD